MDAKANWIDKYKPQILKEIIGHQTIITKIGNWLKKEKGLLLLSGNSGIGKTLLVELLFNEWKEYEKIELEVDDLTPTVLREKIEKSLISGNIKSFFSGFGGKKIFYIDNIDLLKSQTIEEINNYLKQLKKKVSTAFQMICITNDHTDSKLKNIRSKSTIITIDPPPAIEIFKFCKKIINGKMNDEYLFSVIKNSNCDVRKILTTLEYLSYHDLPYNAYMNDIQYDTHTSTAKLLNNKLTINEIEKMYEADSYFLPFFIHSHYLLTSRKLNTICKCADLLSLHDYVGNILFQKGNKENDNENRSIYADPIYSCICPNYYLAKEQNKKKIIIKHPIMFNKKAQSAKNLKLREFNIDDV